MVAMGMPTIVQKEVNFTERFEPGPHVETMKKGTKILVKDQLQSLKRDLQTINVEPKAYLTEFGPYFGTWEAECEAVVSEKNDSQPWISEIFTTKEAVRQEAVRQGLPTMKSYSLEFGDDFRLLKRQKAVIQDLITKKPKLVVMAFPAVPGAI